MNEWCIRDTAELAQVAEAFLHSVSEPLVCLVDGEMGAGKTTFIAAICRELGVLGDSSSPTFSLVNEYETESGAILYHFDCYRLRYEEEALDFGIEEYLDSGNWCFIEWPEIIKRFIPKKHIAISVELQGDSRVIRWECVGFE